MDYDRFPAGSGARYYGEDPQARAFRHLWTDLFLRAEILDPSLDDFRFMETVTSAYVQRISGFTKRQWDWVQRRFRPVIALYDLGPGFYQRRLAFVLKALKEKILAEGYISPADERKAKAERAKMYADKAAAKKAAKVYQKSPEMRAQMSAHMKAVWAKRKRKGNQ